MVDKVYGSDFTDDTNPQSTWSLSIWNGTALRDVLLSNLHKALSAFTGDSGSGGVKGLVPAPSAGDSAKFLQGDGTWATPATGGVTSGPQGFGDNYVITPSVSTNNLTVALKTVSGADPSSSDKITIRIGDVKYELTAAISTTKNAGTNWCNAGSAELAGNPIDFFVYLIQETGASAGTKIGFSRIPHAKTMADFVNTSTDEKYIAGNWTNFTSTDIVENIGRFRAQLSAAASYNWSIASAYVISRPVFQSGWLTYTPTLTGYSANPTNTVYKYKIGQEGFVFINMAEGTNGTSNATTKTYTAPFKSENVTNQTWSAAIVSPVDNAAGQAVGFGIMLTPNSSTISMFKSAAAAWTASGGCRITYFQLEYKV